MHRNSLGLLAAVSLTLAGVAAAAAGDLDMAYKSAPPAPSWTGFYIGANGGAGTGTTQSNVNVGGATVTTLGTITTLGVTGLTLPLSSYSLTGFLGGVQAGYNWQTGPFVLGIEGDFDGATFQGSTSCIILYTCSAKHDWVGDITARLGVVAFDKALIYVKGGAAWADSSHSLSASFSTTTATASISGSATDTAVGGLLGMGIEYGFLPHWSAKIEYDYIQFANQNVNATLTATGATVGTVALPLQITELVQFVKAGVNYHF